MEIYPTARAKLITTAAVSTSTSSPVPGPRSDYTLQITAIATGTSGVGGSVVLQGSNDQKAWIAISSATATATQAGTGTTAVATGVSITGNRWAYVRAATFAVTGTGNAAVLIGA